MTNELTTALAAELERRNLPRRELARRLGYVDNSFAGWVQGWHAAPSGLVRQIEEELGLAPGTLPPLPQRPPRRARPARQG